MFDMLLNKIADGKDAHRDAVKSLAALSFLFFNPCLDRMASEIQAGFDGVFGTVHNLGNFRYASVIEIIENNGFTLNG